MDLFYRIASRLRHRLDCWERLRLFARFKACGQGVILEKPWSIFNPEELVLADRVVINAFCQIFAGGGVRIGEGTMISSHCAISTVTHPVEHPARLGVLLPTSPDEPLHRPVTIGRNVWLGMGAIILPGVTIGDHSIVGAGAVVSKDVPRGVIVTGVPARIQRTLKIEVQDDLLRLPRHD